LEYDSYLNWLVTTKCNFKCPYCCFFSVKNANYEIFSPIDIPKVMQTLKNTGRTYLITISGGEPFLVPNFVELCQALTEQHYIEIITNLSCTKAIEKFIKTVPAKKVKSISSSFHFLEFQRQGISDEIFLRNYNLFKENNFPIAASYVAYPSLLPTLEKDILRYRSQGIQIYTLSFVGNYNGKIYPDAYTSEERDLITQYSYYGKEERLYPKGTLCNAGYNSAVVWPDGDIWPCLYVPMPVGNIFKKIKYNDHLIRCPKNFCGCPCKTFQPELFKNACQATTAFSYPMQKLKIIKGKLYKAFGSVRKINI
jgi:MoaA/NifB/PqqE/SkfB family radical SAM enzyme